MTTVLIRCHTCRHYKGKQSGKSGPSCEAFEVIPPKIITGEHDHRKPYPGDNGITFEPVKPETTPQR